MGQTATNIWGGVGVGSISPSSTLSALAVDLITEGFSVFLNGSGPRTACMLLVMGLADTMLIAVKCSCHFC